MATTRVVFGPDDSAHERRRTINLFIERFKYLYPNPVVTLYFSEKPATMVLEDDTPWQDVVCADYALITEQ